MHLAARRAIGGDREALDGLVRALQGDVYGLALRMLRNREDAEDATQEITGALVGVLMWWLDGRMRLSIDEMNRYFRTLALPVLKAARG